MVAQPDADGMGKIIEAARAVGHYRAFGGGGIEVSLHVATFG